MKTELKNLWDNLWQNTPDFLTITNQYWQELDRAYSHKNRYYHNWEHIYQVFSAIRNFSDKMEDTLMMYLAIFYHDVVYSPLQKDNEERSARLAMEKMSRLGFKENEMVKCRDYILATKTHENTSKFKDLDYFLDADLEKLGSPWPEYLAYTQKIRKEYRVFPDLVYNPGRKKVLEHFLKLESVYKTEEFIARFETQARENMHRETKML